MRFAIAPAIKAAIFCCLLFGCLAVSATADETPDGPRSVIPDPVSYAKQIEPILRNQCFGCHQGAKQLGDYVMTDFASLLAGGESSEPAVVAGKPDDSYLVQQITTVDGHAEMPKSPLKPLSDVDVELVRRWISEGAVNDSPVASGPRFTPDSPPTYQGNPAVPSIDVAPDGKTLAVAGFYEVVLINIESGKTISRLVGLSPRINTVRFSPDGTRLAAIGGTPAVSGEVQIWSVADSSLSLSRQMSFDALTGGSWSPDGTKLAFGATDNVVRAVDTTTGEQVLFQGAHNDWVRDTVFTPDGKHLVSVARDMSCKLTEVETERFVDNLTSITPGALSGGLNSVAMHPGRNEIMVGGADGIAKVYRVIRETKRQIGDDANLIRVLPKIDGRIVSVAISPDGTRLAAAATIDGKTQVRVWKYDFDGTLTDELKKILGNRVASRKAEEKKLVTDYREAATQQLAEWNSDASPVYAIRFSPDNSLFVASTVGDIIQIGPAGDVTGTIRPFEVSTEPQQNSESFDALRWATKSAKSSSRVTDSAPAAESIASITVEPSSINLDSPYAYTQLVVTAKLINDATIDVTRLCEFSAPDFVTLTDSGLIRPIADGSGHLQMSISGKGASVPITAVDTSKHTVDFIGDVNPVLSRLGCNQGTCHGAQKGKNGFKLSLRGYDPIYDLRALTDDLAARRINAASPSESVMLRKPLGTIPHQGGVLMDTDDPNHAILKRWIADGSQLDLASERASRIEVFPMNPVVESVDAQQQVRVVAYYPSGRVRDVTQEAFIDSGNTEVATAAPGGLLAAVRRGEAPILARYEGAYAATTLTVMGRRAGYVANSTETWSEIDELVAQKWDRVKVKPSQLCDDATFLRRAHLDLTGLPPSSDVVRAFLADTTETRQKRDAVVDALIGNDDFVDYWTNKWADLLQVNRKFLGVEGATKFRDWIRKSVADNKPYDVFAREILTATGSNNETPPASYFKVLRNPEDTMENTTHLFMGIRFNCNKCHDHPFERWTQDNYYELAAYFAQVGLQKDPVSKERKIGGTAVEGAKPLFEKVVDLTEGETLHVRTGNVAAPAFPFDVDCDAKPDAPRRVQLATWMTDADNPYFARSYVNRLWGYMMGVGLIEPIDDIRAGNPATNPALLDHLESSLIDSDFDVRSVLREICTSRTYQLAVGTNPLNEDDAMNYSHAFPRRLPAEVIYDAVHKVTGATSAIPGVPAGTRAAALSDSGVKLPDGFLQNLGRPVRESACECERSSGLQLGPVMALISGPTIGTAIADPKNDLEKLVNEIVDDDQLGEEIFVRALGRFPSDAELSAFHEMSGQIQGDHERITAKLAQAEADWVTERKQLETQRLSDLAETKNQITARTEAIKPEREKLEAQRAERVKKAEAALAKQTSALDKLIEEFAAENSDQIEWFPLAASKLSATNKATLSVQPDRSIAARGKTDKGVYSAEFHTGLSKITGLRLEAIADPSLPSGGPGLAPNGNFVVTELEVSAAPAGQPKKFAGVKIASGKADFLQGGFTAEATFDGNKRGNTGWAVSGATGVVHWVTYKFAKPIENADGSVLKVDLHQFHNAAEHTLGRFRISVTTTTGEIPLGTPESLAAAISIPKASRTEAEQKLLAGYVGVTDTKIAKAKSAVAEAKKAVPADSKLTALQAREKLLSVETADSPKLVQLRSDVTESSAQLKNRRLTAAEDLTWALVNSPAFLFNH